MTRTNYITTSRVVLKRHPSETLNNYIVITTYKDEEKKGKEIETPNKLSKDRRTATLLISDFDCELIGSIAAALLILLL